jgi:sarcosine oxidase subunit alpha
MSLESRMNDGTARRSRRCGRRLRQAAGECDGRSRDRIPVAPWPIVAHPDGKNFVDFDEDLQLKDFENAVQEGFDNIELLKRFSTVGMGPSQGKHSNMTALRILARLTGKERPAGRHHHGAPVLPSGAAVASSPGAASTRSASPAARRHAALGAVDAGRCVGAAGVLPVEGRTA